VARFLAEEGDGKDRRNGTQSLAGIAHQAARNIDRNDRQSHSGGGRQSFRGRSLEHAAKACPEDGIHHQFRARQRCGRQFLDGFMPLLCVVVCFAGQMVARSKQGDTDGPSGFGKQASGYEAVAAIVAGATQNGDRAHGPTLLNLASDGSTGILHQPGRQRAGVNRQAIGFAHLADIEQCRPEVYRIHIQLRAQPIFFASGLREFDDHAGLP
jgi:hypothetical protein